VEKQFGDFDVRQLIVVTGTTQRKTPHTGFHQIDQNIREHFDWRGPQVESLKKIATHKNCSKNARGKPTEKQEMVDLHTTIHVPYVQRCRSQQTKIKCTPHYILSIKSKSKNFVT